MMGDASDFGDFARHLAGTGPLPPWHFYSRKAIREAASEWYVDTAGFPTFLGARVRPLGHQIYAARRVLTDRAQRFLLADEVGLGKTIEVGLILQALWHHRPTGSVLIVTPGPIVQQWWRELYCRFGARVFTFLDARDLEEKEKARRFESPWLIVSTTALLRNADLASAVAERRWETLVVDEAHHFDLGHPLYRLVHQISENADNALILSATPSQRELAGMAALLALVAPDEYGPDDVEGLERRVGSRREIWESIDSVGRMLGEAEQDVGALASDDIAYLVEQWTDVLRSDDRIDAHLKRALQAQPKGALDEIRLALAYAQERWRLDHRIIRTRRRALTAVDGKFSDRELVAVLQYDPSGGELDVAAVLEELPAPENDAHRVWVALLGPAP